MKNKKLGLLAMIITASFHLACDKLSKEINDDSLNHKIIVNVVPSREMQTIHSFGASDCWTAKFVGEWNDQQKKDYIADLLFSMDTLDDGSPKGIGLSLWRFNIGGGSYEQGVSSNITDEWRREECFLDADGNYDWNKQKGQQWFLQAAKKRGVLYTLGFSLTPPVFMTKNGKAYNGTDQPNLNIQPGKMGAYADFLASVARYFQFDYLSPVNEPQWQWGNATGGSQEGTQATNAEVVALVRELDKRMQQEHTKIIIAEAGQWNFLYERNEGNRGNQIEVFFSKKSPLYIGDLSQITPTITAHSYFTTCPDNELVKVRTAVREKINEVAPSLDVWQTEFGILGNICNQFKGAPRNIGIDYGLYVAKVIHHDLTIANVNSWQWWLAMSPYDYSDALVYINAPSGNINIADCKNDGKVSTSKQLWAFGNFSRFIRPGMKRIHLDVADKPSAGFWISAYKEVTSRRVVLVAVNTRSEEQVIKIQGVEQNIDLYTTDYNKDLKRSNGVSDEVVIPSKSVVTIVGTYS
ncbi:glycoside hydrolase [Niabella digestorum]|uniref:Glycoside hydrolase n=1 Tax=Niabella digestorum TaxID=3117701 RepID=A0ABU7RES9_9BACT